MMRFIFIMMCEAGFGMRWPVKGEKWKVEGRQAVRVRRVFSTNRNLNTY